MRPVIIQTGGLKLGEKQRFGGIGFNIWRSNLGFTGTTALRRHEYIGKTGRDALKCLASRGGPVCLWNFTGSDYRQGLRTEPLGAAAFSSDLAGAVRIGGVSAPGGILPADPALAGDGAFLSLSGLYGAFIALDDGRADAQDSLAFHLWRFHRDHFNFVAP